MKRVCRNQQYPKWDLAKLLSERQGYDQGGVFHYMQAYTFQYFLATRHLSTLRKVLAALRANTYKRKNWAQITGKPVAEWNRLWHIALGEYCSKAAIQTYPVKCPSAMPNDGQKSCVVVGHGYSHKLWHVTPVATHEDLGESDDVLNVGDRDDLFSDTEQEYHSAGQRSAGPAAQEDTKQHVRRHDDRGMFEVHSNQLDLTNEINELGPL